jgi:hypothetical protein
MIIAAFNKCANADKNHIIQMRISKSDNHTLQMHMWILLIIAISASASAFSPLIRGDKLQMGKTSIMLPSSSSFFFFQ